MSALVSVTVSLDGDVMRFASMEQADEYLQAKGRRQRAAVGGTPVRPPIVERRSPGKTAQAVLRVMSDGCSRARLDIARAVDRRPDAIKTCISNLIDNGYLMQTAPRTRAGGALLRITDAGRREVCDV